MLIFFLFHLLIYKHIHCGEILPGSVPGSIVYQGRIEKNNAPVNGIINLNFKIYGSLNDNDLLWETGYIQAQARAGIFSVTLNPPIQIFGQGEPRYIEIEVEGERLTPREKINSVIYSLIAKKLEDNSSVHFSSVSIGSQLQNTYYKGERLVVGGGIYTDTICFDSSGNCMSGPQEAAVPATLYSSSTVRIRADIDNDNSGDILFETKGAEIARFSNNGNFGIGTTSPTEKLHINGNAYISGNIISGNNINYSGILNNGIVRGQNSEQISIGVIDDRIDFIINETTRVSINNNRLGVGTLNPQHSLDVNGDIRGFILNISTINLSNEIRNLSGHLNLQTSSIYNVGIGTTNPTEKLHVAGAIRAENGILTTTATFTSDVEVLGNLKVNRYGKKIELSSTTVYGTLNVVGEFLVNQGNIAALASTQTFSGINTFSSITNITSHVYITNGLMVYGTNSGAFGSGKYIQVGNPSSVSENAIMYLAGGSNASAKLAFYSGNTKVSEISSLANSFRITHSNSDVLKLYIDSSSTTIYGPTIYLSTSPLSNPTIYINPNGNIGVGTTTNIDEKFVINGNIRLSSPGSYIKFSDGSILTSSSSLSVGSISNVSDAIIYADSDMNGSGNIFFKTNNINAGIITNSGKIGLGILNPQEKLHVIGDVMIGNTLNLYSGDSKSDLLVEGNLVVDGYFKQRSTIPAEFESLYVGGNVFLSTRTASRTGIGTLNPSYKLDVDGDINLTGSLRINGTEIISTTRSISNLTGISSTGTITFLGLTPSRLVATDSSRNLVSNISATDLRNSVSGITGGGNLVFSTSPVLVTPTINTGITVSGWGNFTQGITASSGTFTQTGDYSIVTSSGISIGSTIKANILTPSRLVATDSSRNLVSNISATDLRNSVSGITGDGNLVFSTSPVLVTPTINTGITVSGWGNFTQGITASSGTFTQTGDYSIRTSSGILITTGTINLNNSARIKNLPNPQDSQDAATKAYVDAIGGGSETGAWLRIGNNVGIFNDIGSTNHADVDFIRNSSVYFSMVSWGVDFNVPIISNASITASSGTFGSAGVLSPIIRFANNVYISSTTSSNYGGIYVSTHIYLPSGSIYYGNGSGITNINPSNISAGSLPSNVVVSSIAINTVYTAAIQDNAITDTKIASGISPAKIASGSLPSNVVASSIAVNTVYTAAIQDNAVTNTKIASGIDASKITAGTLPISQMPTGGNWSLSSDLNINSSALTIKNSGNIGIGTANPNSKLQVIGVVNISTSTTSSTHLCLVGAVTSLPTSGYPEGCLVYNSTNNTLYVSTETVTSVNSWKSVW